MLARHLVLNRLGHGSPPRAASSSPPREHLRVVFLSSVVHVGGRLQFEDLQLPTHYNGLLGYANSKLCSIVAAKQFQQRVDRWACAALSACGPLIGFHLDQRCSSWQQVQG